MNSMSATNLAEMPEPLLTEVTELVITTLNLELTLDELDPDTILFGDEGLGLDSIDALEIALIVEHRYGIKVEAEDEANQTRFSSVRALTDFIRAERTK